MSMKTVVLLFENRKLSEINKVLEETTRKTPLDAREHRALATETEVPEQAAEVSALD
jgi:hypothetical protein